MAFYTADLEHKKGHSDGGSNTMQTHRKKHNMTTMMGESHNADAPKDTTNAIVIRKKATVMGGGVTTYRQFIPCARKNLRFLIFEVFL